MPSRAPRPSVPSPPPAATLAPSATEPPGEAEVPTPGRAGLPHLGPDEPRARVRTWQVLAERAQACTACPLHVLGTQTVFGEGPVGAPLMLVGEQPGDQEDVQGRPFVGPAGQLLERMLAELQWARERLYVTNAVKHFKFEWRGKRRMHKTPAQREIDACNPWLQQEIALVQPQALVALGSTAARALLGAAVPVLANRGQWLTRPQDGRPVLITLHPSALLRVREGRAEALAAWRRDLERATEILRPASR